jgi:formylglycine-generating enzyme required for sulfatase activity
LTAAVAALCVCSTVAGAATAAPAADPAWYGRRGSWQETAYASREALAGQLAAEAARRTAAGTLKLGPWYASKGLPAPKGVATTGFAEEAGSPAWDSAEGAGLWTRQDGWRDGVVTNLAPGQNIITYVARTIQAAAAGEVEAYIGYDDQMVVWLNGQAVFANPPPHGVAPNQHKIALPLRAGDNRLLMKVFNTVGPYAFYFSTDAAAAADQQAAEARLWELLRRDFGDDRALRQMQWEQADGLWRGPWDPIDAPAAAGGATPASAAEPAKRLAGLYARYVQGPAGEQARKLAAAAAGVGDLPPIRELYYRAKEQADAAAEMAAVNLPALRRVVEDLSQTYPDTYGRRGFLQRLEEFERDWPATMAAVKAGDAAAVERAGKCMELRREALLANPLLDFDKLLLVKRDAKSPSLGLPANWEGNCALARSGFADEIMVLSPVRPDGKLMTLFRPQPGRFVGDVDLHFDADRMLFSMPNEKGRWHLWEIKADLTAAAGGSGLRQLTPTEPADVDNYDGCYLPDGRIAFCSTVCLAGVPCVGGSAHVANLCLLGPESPAGGARTVRQLCFDQDHNWCPTVLPNGRILYLRWEYTDTPHAFNRILFHMNPDGTGQAEYYGSNSYWPNALFYARPVPGEPSKFVGIVTGHHGVARMGEMVLFDQAKGRYEADGALQRIGQYGKPVKPVILDNLVDASWPKFLHPWPLNSKYFLASAQVRGGASWCVYLVDVWDNMLKLCEVPGSALLEPVPLRPTPRPPAVPDRVELARKDAVVYLVDVYAGAGLRDVPRGTIRKLRLFTYNFAYWGMGGQPNRVGLDGPWDVKRILGTVPVRADGSACFRVPANTPISVQPLDERGQAVQVMRSWFTAMPGEALSCVGCHERQSDAPRAGPQPTALAGAPDEIEPWRGPARGFSFRREVQPVLDRHCVGCHNGQARPDGGPAIADLRDAPDVVVHPIPNQHGMGKFSPSYYAVRRFARTPTIESDLHMLDPWEYHAETTKLVQMLRKGHHAVSLDEEGWDRLITWLDLSAPCHGTWHEIVGAGAVNKLRDRRRELKKLYAGVDEDPEEEVGHRGADLPAGGKQAGNTEAEKEKTVQGAKTAGAATLPSKNPSLSSLSLCGQSSPPSAAQRLACPGWPFDSAEAARRQTAEGDCRRTVDLGGGVTMQIVRIPAGEFVMGDANGLDDERPLARVRIDRAFWMGTCEVTNEQYARFDPTHDSRVERGAFLQFSERERGDAVNGAHQPVCRVSWVRATAFCRWLGRQTGQAFDLPTEAQWEYACRAGTAGALNYGGIDTDHAKLANLADLSLKTMSHLGWDLPYAAIPPWHPTDGRFNDGARVSADVGKYQPNAWGLFDMHGNVAEWTRSDYRPYPYRQDDGRNAASPTERKVVRGGSWYDRPKEARSAFRGSYRPCQGVYDVGFRVMLEDRPAVAAGRS